MSILLLISKYLIKNKNKKDINVEIAAAYSLTFCIKRMLKTIFIILAIIVVFAILFVSLFAIYMEPILEDSILNKDAITRIGI